jgi:acetyl-CoA synthetase
VNCVDRHYKKNPNKVAIIWEKDEPGSQEYVTYEYVVYCDCAILIVVG